MYNILGLVMITPEIIQTSPQYINEANQYVLDLRSKKFTSITSMAATLNFYQCIDLSDNLIGKLGGFTYLDQLTTLILANNWISTITDISQYLPNLENLMLMNNKILSLYELPKLGNCRKLKRLVLTNNPVTDQLNYRKTVVARIPSLNVLDFKTITAKQKKQAKQDISAENQTND